MGAATVRRHVLGEDDVAPTPEQLERMRALVREAMEEGALGLGSALIYVPGCFATTDELVALSEVVARYGGIYISHLRSEGDRFVEAVDELLTIARRAGCGAEIFHLKATGQANWPKLDTVIATVEAARAGGLQITADMYTYAASSTGLDATMPPWVREGGHRAWVARLQDPALRARLEQEMGTPSTAWENRLLNVGAENVLLVSFRNPALRPLVGATLAQVAASRGVTPASAAMDLVVEDDSRVGTVYFAMSEDNVRRQIRLPWVSFCSDSPPLAPEGEFLQNGVHPRAYGTFARLLGRYVRDEGLIPLQEAVRAPGRPPRGHPQARPKGPAAPGLRGGRGGLRSRRRPGPRHVRAAPPVRHRRPPRPGERHRGGGGRRAHRRHPGARRPRPGEEDLSFQEHENMKRKKKHGTTGARPGRMRGRERREEHGYARTVWSAPPEEHALSRVPSAGGGRQGAARREPPRQRVSAQGEPDPARQRRRPQATARCPRPLAAVEVRALRAPLAAAALRAAPAHKRIAVPASEPGRAAHIVALRAPAHRPAGPRAYSSLLAGRPS